MQQPAMKAPVDDRSRAAGNVQVAYVSSSSYSGSTLLAFLLNGHPDIVTVSEMEGWRFEDPGEFPCSCGRAVQECPFFNHIERAFRDAGLAFDYRDFGTAFRLSESERWNRWLTANLPRLHSSRLEHWRDRLLRSLPAVTDRLVRTAQRNRVFIRAALNYAGAQVFVDATKTPHRMRYLGAVEGLELKVIHLVRDVRGVALSNMRKRNWAPDRAARVWLQNQEDIARISDEVGEVHLLFYEDLCSEPENALNGVYRFLGLAPQAGPVRFRQGEHHILGNVMRMRQDDRVQLDERWKRELSSAARTAIERTVRRRGARIRDPRVQSIIGRYLGS